MRATRLITYRQPLEVTSIPTPEPTPDGVVARVLVYGVCRPDWYAWSGSDPDVVLPMTPCHEYCGEVAAVGNQVKRWRVGDRVIAPFILACGQCPECAQGLQTTCPDQVGPGFTCDGAFAEFISVTHADANLTTLPDDLPPTIAATLECRVTTAWQALVGRVQVQGGEWLVAFGGGGVGISTLLLGKALGARVVAVDIADDKLAYAKRLGADAVVNATTCAAPQAIKDLTGGGAQVAIEALGGQGHGIGHAVSTQTGPNGPDRYARRRSCYHVATDGRSLFWAAFCPWHMWNAQLRYPPLLSLISGGGVDLGPLVTRQKH